MNGAVLPILAFYIVAAKEQGVSEEKLRGEKLLSKGQEIELFETSNSFAEWNIKDN